MPAMPKMPSCSRPATTPGFSRRTTRSSSSAAGSACAATAAWDVAQDVCLRLLAELRRGKRYSVPYRVVVFNVVKWTIRDHFAGRPTDVPLPDGWDAPSGEDPYADWEQRHDPRGAPRTAARRRARGRRAPLPRGTRDRPDRRAARQDAQRRRPGALARCTASSDPSSMQPDVLSGLFDEWAASLARGEQPDPQRLPRTGRRRGRTSWRG